MWPKLAELVLGPLLAAFGQAINDYLGRTRAEQAQRDLGAAQAHRDVSDAALAATEAQLKAAVDAPRTIPGAIAALRRGEA